MTWYYASDGKQNGPVNEPEWDRLVASGSILPETLVWHEGLENWAPFSAVKDSAPPASALAPAHGSDGVPCAECGASFPADEVVMIKGQPVCAVCKPIALQKLKEGVQLTGEMRYAGFWIRFGAKFIDGIIMQIIVRGLALLLGLGLNATGSHSTTTATWLSALLGTVVGATYSIWFNGKYGATPGKMACELRIVRSDGSPLTYGRACGRYFAEIVSSLTLLIGYIMAGFDEEKRALHDRICDTRVIHG